MRDPGASSLWLVLMPAALFGCFSDAIPLETSSLTRQDPIAQGHNLTVLPIGDSVTRGSGDDPDPDFAPRGGYREGIYEKLIARGNNVEMVGSLSEGDFDQNRHEGHRGKKIAEIQELGKTGMAARPNIALLHAGTNDIAHPAVKDVPGPDELVRDLVELIKEMISQSPDVVVLVAMIVPNRQDGKQALTDAYNDKVESQVSDLADQGLKVVLVDMTTLDAQSDMNDDLHPNPAGYAKMAQKWYDAVEEADKKEWIN